MTPVELFEEFRNKHRDFYNEVKRLHDTHPDQRGHDMYHNIHVALVGLEIADKSIQELVWLSAIPHSLDRVLGQDRFEEAVKGCLMFTQINNEQSAIVLDAVLKHSLLNDQCDSEVLVALKDADRIANMFLTFVIRAGQHRPQIPACEMRHLRTSNPSCLVTDVDSHSRPASVFDDIRYCSTNWPGMMRNPLAKVLVQPLVMELERFLGVAASQYEGLGMDKIEL